MITAVLSRGLQIKKDREVSATKRLPKRNVNVFAFGMTFFGEANARLTKENLAGLATSDVML